MALTPGEIAKIVGPTRWNHVEHLCYCDVGAPEKLGSKMSDHCKQDYMRGIVEREERIVKLVEVVNREIADAIRIGVLIGENGDA